MISSRRGLSACLPFPVARGLSAVPGVAARLALGGSWAADLAAWPAFERLLVRTFVLSNECSNTLPGVSKSNVRSIFAGDQGQNFRAGGLILLYSPFDFSGAKYSPMNFPGPHFPRFSNFPRPYLYID